MPKSKFEICKLTKFRYETEGVAVEESVSQTTSPLGSVLQFALTLAEEDVGAGVGLAAMVGVAVGVALGAIVGVEVGAIVGMADAVALGEAVGVADGASVGTAVDGLAVGFVVAEAFATMGATGWEDPLHAARAMTAT